MEDHYHIYGYSCFVYVFDRKEKNFWNVLVNTNPGYHVALGLLLVDASLDYDSIIFEDCQFEDINEDMQEEIIVHFRLRFADRVDNLVAVIQNHDNEWELITPDFSLVEEELRQMGYEDCRVLWDEFSLYDVNKKEAKSIFCAFNLSGITTVENPLWGGNDWMYSATVDDGTTGMLSANHFVFIMERITDNGFDREPNWNGGLVKYCSLDQLENFDLENEWGVSTRNVRFFGGDVD